MTTQMPPNNDKTHKVEIDKHNKQQKNLRRKKITQY